MSNAAEKLWQEIRQTLLAMKDIYPKIATSTATQSEINGFLAQSNVVADKTQALMNAIGAEDDGGKIASLSRFHDDIAALLKGELRKAQPLCGDLVRQFLQIANFHVLHQEGDQARWKGLAQKYRKMLDALPPK